MNQERNISREQYVFDRLADERSRQVFAVRQKAVKYYHPDYSKTYPYMFSVIQEFAEINEGHRQKTMEDFIAEFSAKNSRFILYGAAIFAKSIVEKLFSVNNARIADCVEVWDINPSLTGEKLFGIPITPPLEKIDIVRYSDVEVLVTQTSSILLNEITTYLLSLGFRKEQIITLEEVFSMSCNYGDFEPFRQTYHEEIFVDGGCLNFNSSREFLQICNNVKKIYAFEPCLDAVDTIKRNIKLCGFKNVNLINAALWSEKTSLNFEVTENSLGESHVVDNGNTLVKALPLDSAVEPDEKITFIKLDIEGAEMEALIGMRETICRCRPKLAICIYHKPYDYIEIPEYVLSLVPEYKIYMRHYSDNIAETVMFAHIE